MTSNKKVRRRKDAERLRPKAYIDNVEAPLWKHGIYNLKKKEEIRNIDVSFVEKFYFILERALL